MSRTIARGASRALLGASIPFLAAAVLITLGVFDKVAPDQTISRFTALVSVLCYWLLAFVAVGAMLAWRHRRSALLAVSLGFVIAASLLEIGLRVAAPHLAMLRLTGVSSSRFHHGYPPDRLMYAGLRDGHPVIVRTNEDGLRSDYSRSEFLAYQHRIIMLGDSFTFGVGVLQEDTFPEVTQALLRRSTSTRDIAVLNAGIVSFSPLLHRLLFQQKLVMYEPSQVILILDATDIGDDYQYAKEAVMEGGEIRFPYGDGSVTYCGALIEAVRQCKPYLVYPWLVIPAFRDRVSRGYRYDRFAVDLNGIRETNRFFIYRHPLERTEPFFRATLSEIEAIARGAGEVGAEFTLFILPRFHLWNIADCLNNWEGDRYQADEPYQLEMIRFFEDVSDEIDFEVVNLLPAFLASGEQDLVFDDDPHLNKRGHAFVGAQIADYLLRRIGARHADAVSTPGEDL